MNFKIDSLIADHPYFFKERLPQPLNLAFKIHPPNFKTTTSALYAISTLAHFLFWLRNTVISSLALVLTIVPQGKIQTR